MTVEHLTVSGLSLALRLPEHALRRAVRENVIHTERAGRIGFFKATDLPAIEAALRDAGYLPLVPPAPSPVDPATLPAAGLMM